MVDLSRLDLDIEDLKERMSDLEMEHESVLTRLTALETARATAPVSDDEEIVDVLARTVWGAVYLRNTGRDGSWPDDVRNNLHSWTTDAREQLARLRAAGYDLVKRS